MKHKNRELLSENVNLRLTSRDLHLIAAEAEDNCIGKADVLRTAWREYLHQKELSILFAELEQRLTKKVFEIVTAVAGLDENERLLALKKYKKKLNSENKK